ncbi:demethylmenaquinone methyltransferase, putative [Phytophthora infestans T30-4]|uniref:Demethylmenaquinone methyltransferase, putative n=1 Tax=Phytophthora infestans (strain T30-4) TaxID=403677 RepID=D0ND60_PHYIT|nr:demethylmenaquinone methyltransferase, putative [Phytophthora infestans T30-4]EEY56017.1 demethylmenaquinone methyltransferase, putative [Phytophthora infestans T30-4]|eukprot:XP_002902847.1 demethylmenaquinone methyltransferase, putative [Phytophthora infestans T30-4]
MGRKPSNVYDFFTRLEPETGRKGLVRYQCKKCDKQYASNATRLAEHLKMSCVPGFQTNQRSRRSMAAASSAPATDSLHETKAEDEPEEPEELEDSTDSMAATVASLAVPTSSPDTFSSSGVETAQSLALKRADQQLLTNMLESEAEPPQDQTEVLLRLAKLSTCVIGDAMAVMKIKGHLVDLDLVRGYDAPLAMNICGPALTVKMMPITGATVGTGSYDYMDAAEMGQVVVISAPSGISTAVFDGILATAPKARNVAGVVTDGRVRDVQELCAMNFPAFATGTSVHGVWGSTTIGDVNCPIVVAGCVVRHNDIIRGDINGVIVIPAERAQDVATRAEIIEDQDR